MVVQSYIFFSYHHYHYRFTHARAGIGSKVTSLRTAKNNTVFITVEGPVIKLWSARTGACLLMADDRPDPAVVCVAMEGAILVALTEGTNTFRSWEMDNFKQLCEVRSMERGGGGGGGGGGEGVRRTRQEGDGEAEKVKVRQIKRR